MARKLKDAVVVITGASSGIGRATAHAFARAGARLVLAARGEGELERAAEECRALGADAVAVPLDVADEQAVRDLAGLASERFGRIDVWVNNASVGGFGRVEEMPIDDFRRVVEVDLFGADGGADPAEVLARPAVSAAVEALGPVPPARVPGPDRAGLLELVGDAPALPVPRSPEHAGVGS
jgi:NAD(P)-dependent dehydrogenase (short-subunit alcohol dehydrogenase family)